MPAVAARDIEQGAVGIGKNLVEPTYFSIGYLGPHDRTPKRGRQVVEKREVPVISDWMRKVRHLGVLVQAKHRDPRFLRKRGLDFSDQRRCRDALDDDRQRRLGFDNPKVIAAHEHAVQRARSGV
jgi:hypothetical protein